MIPSNTAASLSYVGNDTSNVFTFPFRILTTSNLKAYVIEDVDGTKTNLVLSTHFNLTFKAFPLLGGTLTLVNGAFDWIQSGNLKTGFTLYIEYVVIPGQGSQFRDLGPQAPVTFEKQFDKMAMDVAGLKDLVERSLSLPPSSDPALDPTFPPLTGNADKILTVNPTGDGFIYGPTVTQIEGWKTDAQNAATASEASAVTSAGHATTSLGHANTASAQAASATASALVASGKAVDADNSAIQAAAEAAEAVVQKLAAQSFAEDAEASAIEADISANLMLFDEIVELTFADSPYNANATTDNGRIFKIDCAGGNFIFNLPTRPSISPDFHVGIVKTDPSANTITVEPFGADTINSLVNETVTEQSYGLLATPGLFSDWKGRIFIVEGATGGASGGLYTIPSTTQTISNGGQIIPSSGQQWLKLQGNAGDITLDTDLFSAAPPDGTIITLEGQNDSAIVMVPFSDTAGGFVGNGDCYLKRYSTLTLVYDEAALRYKELTRNGL
jgi:hypothetical protein